MPMVHFLYNGQVSDFGTEEVITNLIDLFGFSKSMQITREELLNPIFMPNLQGILYQITLDRN